MAAIIFGIIAGAATLLGMWLVLAREAWARRHSVYLIAFASGTLLAAAFTDIIPEAMKLLPNALHIILATFFLSYVFEHSILAHHDHVHDGAGDRHDTDVPVEKLAFVGLTIHSLVDGLAIGAGFGVSTTLGTLATIAVILHEIPEGMTSLSLFLHAGYPRRRAIMWSAVVALATPAGAIITTLIPQLLTPIALGASLAVAGGSFLYVATADLIPETHHARHIPAILLMLLGMIIPIAVKRMLG